MSEGVAELRDRIAALEQHISELEKSLENVRKERDEALARLKPSGHVHPLPVTPAMHAALDEALGVRASGQVAEDVERVREALLTRKGPIALPDLADEALSRLAAKAQGYEAAVADNAELLAHLVDELGHDDDCEYGNLVRQSIMGRCPAPEASTCTCIIGRPHPGAALLERMKKLEETCRRLSNFRCDNEKQSDPDPTKPNCGACVVCEARLALAPH